jgi:hypothetical protein
MSDESSPIGWYRELNLEFADGTKEHMIIERKPTGTHIPLVRPAPWTRLGYYKCPCCPLPGEYGQCPAALSMQTTVDRLRHRTSTETVTATAIDDHGKSQTVSWPLQMVGSIMVQLAVFSSDCPVGRRIKPYLKGLSPFASSADVLKHVVGGVLGTHQGEIEGARKEIREIIEPLRQIFEYLLLRLRGDEKAHQDAIPNSIVHVDTLTQIMSFQANKLTDQVAAQLGTPAKPQEGLSGEKPGLWNRLFGSK